MTFFAAQFRKRFVENAKQFLESYEVAWLPLRPKLRHLEDISLFDNDNEESIVALL